LSSLQTGPGISTSRTRRKVSTKRLGFTVEVTI
jgi:hypothetical protein